MKGAGQKMRWAIGICTVILLVGLLLVGWGRMALASPDTATLVPNEDITTQWTSTGASHYTEIDEGIASPNDSDKIYTPVDTLEYIDKFGLTSVSGVSQCTGITVKVRTMTPTFYYYDPRLDVKLHKADDTQIGTTWTIGYTDSNVWHDEENTWSGLSLSQSDIDGLRVELRKYVVPYSGEPYDVDVHVSALDVVITYSSNEPPATPTLADTPAFTNLKTYDTTPVLGNFSTTDPESDDVDYQIQWDEDYNFGSPVTKSSSDYPPDAGWTAATFSSGEQALPTPFRPVMP